MTLNWLNRRSDPIIELQLLENGELKESLQLNPRQQSVRIKCDGYHQVFLLDQIEPWNGQVRFSNAYGIQSGMMNFDGYPALSGLLELEDQDFICLHSRKERLLEIYQSGAPEFRISAFLPTDDDLPIAHAIPHQRLEMEATVLLALCWHLLRSRDFAMVEMPAVATSTKAYQSMIFDR